MSKDDIIRNAENFVRETFEHDMKQRVDDQKVREIAERVAKSIPRQMLERA